MLGLQALTQAQGISLLEFILLFSGLRNRLQSVGVGVHYNLKTGDKGIFCIFGIAENYIQFSQYFEVYYSVRDILKRNILCMMLLLNKP